MNQPAHITSTDAVRALRTALQEYEADLRDALEQLLLEVRRAVDWVEHDRARYWPQAFRKASDALAEARAALERAEAALRPEDKRACYEHRLVFEKAKRRLRLTEEKMRSVRKWRVVITREAEEFEGKLARLTNYLDTEFPRALAALDRMATALDKYTDRAPPREAGPKNASTDGGDSPEKSKPSSESGGNEP